MPRKWVDVGLLLLVCGLFSGVFSALYAKQIRRRLEWYVDGKVASN